MPSYKCEQEGVSLVLLGNFDPSIIQPSWLAKHKLIRGEEAEQATIELIHPELAKFSVGDFMLTVQQDRFQIETSVPEAGVPLRDLAAAVFSLLEHTPLTAAGINRNMHFKMPSTDEWHDVGHRLAPKEIWEGLVEAPGTRSLKILGKRPQADAEWNIVIEPSSRVNPGVYIGTNEHYAGDGQELLAKVNAVWEPAQQKARLLAEKILNRCLEDA